MIGATTAAVTDAVIPKKIEPNPANNGSLAGSGDGATFTAAYESIETESLHVKISSKDGDVVELDWEHREETFAGVTFSGGPARPGQKASAGDAAKLAGANSEAAQPSATGADATSPDARLQQLSRLRDWAAQVAEEVRKQQKRILEETLKQSGKFMPGSDGRFIVIYGAPDAAGNANGASADAEKGIPEYWNAENTSDRIVKFATQMAEIAGKDSDFAKTIIKAVADGFDQANAMTGPMPGAAGELNKKTRELTFAKLSKWLDDRKSMGYNQVARTEEIPNPDTTHGSENHEQ
ncbi:MAG: hypothetical protein JF616_11855 [Fibrobacteres bacterium]|nr:hypothetical protein [Fibrobacterota bacterium]